MIKNILITGAAGFIGMSTSIKFLDSGFSVLDIDNLNTYYDKPKTKIINGITNFVN